MLLLPFNPNKSRSIEYSRLVNQYIHVYLCADGTEIGAVVADIGAHMAKLGFAGEDAPRAYFSSVRTRRNDMCDRYPSF